MLGSFNYFLFHVHLSQTSFLSCFRLLCYFLYFLCSNLSFSPKLSIISSYAYFSCNLVFSPFKHPRICSFFPDGFNLIISLFVIVSVCNFFSPASKQGQWKSVHIISTSIMFSLIGIVIFSICSKYTRPLL